MDYTGISNLRNVIGYNLTPVSVNELTLLGVGYITIPSTNIIKLTQIPVDTNGNPNTATNQTATVSLSIAGVVATQIKPTTGQTIAQVVASLTTNQFCSFFGDIYTATVDQGKSITALTYLSGGQSIRETDINNLIAAAQYLSTQLQAAQTNIATNTTNIATNTTNITTAQTLANTANANASAAQTAASNAQTTANTAQTTANNAQTAVNIRAKFTRVTTIDLANATQFDLAYAISENKVYYSDGSNWFAFGSGGGGTPLTFSYFAFKTSSVSANGCSLEMLYNAGALTPVIKFFTSTDGGNTWDAGTDISASIPTNGSGRHQYDITGKSVGTYKFKVNISDADHALGTDSGVITFTLILPTSTITVPSWNKTQMVVSGTPSIATQATITKIRVAYQLQGTDASADAAVSAGRYFDLTAGGDITSFQGAGYTKTSLTLTPGANYIPSVQITANTGTGVSQTGAWTAGTSILIDPAPTAPVISASTNGSGNVTVILTTASTDATPETLTYDIAVWDSVGSAWVAKQTSIAGNSSYLTGTALGTSYANGTTLQVRVTAKDTHNNAIDSNIVNLTVTNQAPVASSVNITGTASIGSTLTGNYTYSDPEGNPQGTSTFRWLRNGVAISGATAQTYLLVNADVGTTITFEVTPVATVGTLTGTPVVSSGVAIPVPVLTGVSITAGNAQNTVSWNAGISGAVYNLYWSTSPGVTKANGTKIAGVTSPYPHTGLTNGVSIYYVVTQVVNSIESADSTQQSGTPTLPVTYQTSFAGTNGTAPDTGYFTTMKVGAGVAQLNGSGQLELNSLFVDDGELVYRTTSINRTAVKTYKNKFQVPSTTGFTKQMAMAFIDSASKVAPDLNAVVAPIQRMQMQVTYDATNGLRFIVAYRNTDTGNTNPFVIWDTGTNSYVLSSGTWSGYAINTNTIYTVILETTATQWRVALKSSDESTTLMQTTWLNWSSTMTFASSAWMYMGDPWTDFHTGKILIEEFTEI